MAVLGRYRYDPLDRLASTTPLAQVGVRCFYQKSRLATEIQGAVRRTVFQHDDQLLAQQRRTDTVVEADLLATDQQRSVVQRVSAGDVEALVYSAYGHHSADSGLSCLLGFNGERRDPVTGHYLLGNGYRAFNPVLMRFNSPDSLSPFAEGGLNAYGYCQGDPVNFRDPTGHIKIRVPPLSRSVSSARPTPKPIAAPGIGKSDNIVDVIASSAIESTGPANQPSTSGGRPLSSPVNAGSTNWVDDFLKSLESPVITAPAPAGSLSSVYQRVAPSASNLPSSQMSISAKRINIIKTRLGRVMKMSTSADAVSTSRGRALRKYNTLKMVLDDAAELRDYYRSSGPYDTKAEQISRQIDALTTFKQRYKSDYYARFTRSVRDS